ncbi:MAG: DUF167 family protein [Hyphomicrobiales bacterium]|nr:DUF167 family protein [Hyphomicrobiales bacterium]
MAARAARPYRKADAGLVVKVRLTPKSTRDEVGDIALHGDTPALRARVCAAPEKGRANAALEKLVARWLGVPPSRVNVTSGAKSRTKSLTIAGDADRLAKAFDVAVAGNGEPAG